MPIRTKKMDDWIDYYDSTHTIYVSKLHRDVHFRVIANDILAMSPRRMRSCSTTPAARRCSPRRSQPPARS
jgi:hypothetical protein